MTPHLALAVSEPSQVGEARRAAMRLADQLGFDETQAGRLSIVVTELGNNLARHATGGRLLLGRRWDDGAGREPSIDVLSLDTGPGMADVNDCLRDGFSTAGTPGTGFGAVKRLSDAFGVYSVEAKGTVILSRISALAAAPAAPATQPEPPSGRFEVAGLSLAAPGETVSGDAWAARFEDGIASVMVADGLGHGPVAAEAADAAVAFFLASGGTPSRVLAAAHPVLRSTRGAAAAVATLDARARKIVFAGAGNIAGRIVSGVDDRALMSQHGTLGVQVRRLDDIVYPWPDHACLVLHSDGVNTRWSFTEVPGLLQCDPLLIAAWVLRDHCRGRDDATVVVARCR